MNGVHDLGGMHGFGPVEREANEPVFHEPWEGVVYTINRATRVQGIASIDEFRHTIERMPPPEYLSSSYYQRWLTSAERSLIEKGVITREELEAKVAELQANPDAPLPERRDPALVERLTSTLTCRPDYQKEMTAPPRFAEGDRVRTRNLNPTGHTRLPRYARGKRGLIHRVHGTFIFPDTNAHGRGEQPQPLYSVCFEAGELWSDAAEPRELIYLDLWESYLDGGQEL